MRKRENRERAVREAGKSSFWLLFTLLFAAVIILSSMFCMRSLIKNRENALLSGKGTVKQNAPVSGSLNTKKGEKVTLSPEDIQEVMTHWQKRSGIVVHEPVEGQIAMGEAVKAVDEWIVKMGISEGILSGNSVVRSSLNIARIKGEKPEILSPLYSFWVVTVSGDKMDSTFYVNAATGQIYEAYLNLLSEPEGVTKEQLLKSFIRLAGLKADEQKGFSEEDEDFKEYWSMTAKIEGCSMTAQASCLYEWADSGSVITSGGDEVYDNKQMAVSQARAEYRFLFYAEE